MITIREPLLTIFVYATLKRQNIIQHVLHRHVAERAATLYGWRQVYGEWPSIVADRRSICRGDLLILKSVAELTALDNWEEKYERHQVTVRDHDIGDIQAWVYILDRRKL